MRTTKQRIYCAGPLFNEPEKREMAEISAMLEGAGYETFLPQRDGLELSRLQPELSAFVGDSAQAASLVDRAIFSLDAYKLLGWAHGVVVNLNGRVPDEGTVVEAALGWHSGKAVVLYKRDERAPFSARDNPMLTGLVEGEAVSAIAELPAAVEQALAASNHQRVAATLTRGERIAGLGGTSWVGEHPGTLARALLEALGR